jgi:hypothetical protein
MNILWQLQERVDSQLWNRKISQLMTNLETAGCEMSSPVKTGSDDAISVFLPGLDALIPTTFKSTHLWDRAEFKLNRQSQSIECRWIYWSPTQVFIHTAICCLFILKVYSQPEPTRLDLGLLLLGCGVMNTLAVFLSLKEKLRLKAFFIASGFTR